MATKAELLAAVDAYHEASASYHQVLEELNTRPSLTLIESGRIDRALSQLVDASETLRRLELEEVEDDVDVSQITVDVVLKVGAAELWNAVFLEDFETYIHWKRINVRPVLWSGPGHSATVWGEKPTGEVVKIKGITVETLASALADLVRDWPDRLDALEVGLWTDREADRLLQQVVFGELLYPDWDGE